MGRPKLLVFASGTKDGGGSGFENLATSKELHAEIVAVVSNHEHGGVRERAERLGILFIYMPPPYDAEHYRKIVAELAPWRHGGFTGWIALSGWLKHVQGLDPARTFNIHPALLSFDHGPFDGLRTSRFGGPGMYGRRLHEAVKAAFDAGEITESGFSMHFVTDTMDGDPVFFKHRVPLHKGMSADEIAMVVNKAEHEWQPKITNMVVHGQIQWDGKDPATLEVPPEFK